MTEISNAPAVAAEVTENMATISNEQPVSSLSMDDRPLPTLQKSAFNLANINSRRGSKSPVDGTAGEVQTLADLPNGQLILSKVNSRRGSESPANVTRGENGISDVQNNGSAPQSKIMEDSLVDATEVFGGTNGERANDPSTVLANATMEDSLDLTQLKSTEPNKVTSAKEFYVNSGSTAAAGLLSSAEDLALHKKRLEAATANEIFNDPAGMDFLANAGSKSGVHDSEYARQSLYQNFDPFVGKPTAPAGVNWPMAPPPTVGVAPSPINNRTAFRNVYPTQSHTATTDMIAAMQQKQNAILRQQAASTDRLNMHPPAAVLTEPSSWPDAASRREVTPVPLSSTSKGTPQTTSASLPQQFHTAFTTPTPPQIHASSASAFHVYSPLENGSGDGHRGLVNGGERPDGPNFDESDATDASQQQPMAPPGSLVNFGLAEGSPRRPVTLRTKPTNHLNSSANKQLYRRSVPAGFLDGREGLLGAAMSPLESHEEFSGYPELNPMWENVVATYEGLLRVTLNKMAALQAETCEAKQREAKAVKDQEEMHRVFVALHERFETSKTVITTLRTNQETLQRAFDDLNAEFQPALQENKKMQATVRMNEIKTRKLEHDIEKKNDEIAELTKIVDDLISKDS